MAQLFFKYSTMNAGKSIELIKVAHNYEERGKRVLVFTPAIDTRSGVGIIESRIGLKREGVPVEDDTNLLSILIRENEKHEVSCVLVDECQFLKKHHVEELLNIGCL